MTSSLLSPLRIEDDDSSDVRKGDDEEATSRKTAGGRPRSEHVHQSILDATNKLLLHAPVREISIEAIAKKAGVGKTAVYRRWANKLAVILDAISGPMGVIAAPVSGGDAKDLLVRQLERFARLTRGRGGKVIAEVLAEAQGDADMTALFFQNFMVQHEEILASIIDQGKASGDFRKNLDTALAVDMIYGAIFYRLMSAPDPIDHSFSDSLIMESLRILK